MRCRKRSCGSGHMFPPLSGGNAIQTAFRSRQRGDCENHPIKKVGLLCQTDPQAHLCSPSDLTLQMQVDAEPMSPPTTMVVVMMAVTMPPAVTVPTMATPSMTMPPMVTVPSAMTPAYFRHSTRRFDLAHWRSCLRRFHWNQHGTKAQCRRNYDTLPHVASSSLHWA